MMPPILRVSPEWEDILYGKPGDPRGCAIARFVHRKYPQFTHIQVSDKYIGISDPSERTRYRWATPLAYVQWLKNFDKSSNPGLIVFDLRRNESLTTPMKKRTKADRQRSRQYEAEHKERLATETSQERAERQRQAQERTLRSRRGRTHGPTI